MAKASLVIMAGGMASRYGSLKQLEKFGPNGELLVDYSIFDAKRAGFDRVVFIIKEENLAVFKENVGDRVSKHIQVDYVFQGINDLPEGSTKFIEREKPWGTSHAIWCCRDVVKEPFAVINADDYYGPEAFKLVYDFLTETEDAEGVNFCLAGYVLKNTLSDSGTVSRGVCQVDENNLLTGIREHKKIEKGRCRATSYLEDGTTEKLVLSSPVSMNFFGLTPDIFPRLDNDLKDFFAGEHPVPEKAECLLPESVGKCIEDGFATVKVLSTNERWFGVTYKEDKPMVKAAIEKLIKSKVYPESLWD